MTALGTHPGAPVLLMAAAQRVEILQLMPRPVDPGQVDRTSLPEAKIALFRSLFRVRDDVYARRFESRKTGKSGYAPACANEWVRGICEKPRVKCADCRRRRLLPLTDDVIRWHLSGCDHDGEPFVAGGYPLFADETCAFLAIDFDKAEWCKDVRKLAIIS